MSDRGPTLSVAIRPGTLSSVLLKLTGLARRNRLFSAMGLIAVLTLGAKLVNLAKEMMVASTFGISDSMDAYLFAIIFPTMAMAVVGAAMNGALIPVYVRTREGKGFAAAETVFAQFSFMGLVAFILVSILLGATANYFIPYLAPSFSAEKMRLAMQLFYLLLPISVFSGMTAIWNGVLNAQERFGSATFTQIFRPVAILAALLVPAIPRSVEVLAGATSVGYALEWICLGYVLKRHGHRLLPAIPVLSPEIRTVIRQFIPICGATLIMTGKSLVDNYMAAGLPENAVSQLNYGIKLVDVASALAIASIGTVALPYFSKLAARNDTELFMRKFWKGALLSFLAGTAMAAFFLAFSHPLVRLIFQRGNFNAADADLVADIQRVAALQFPVFLLGIVAVRAITAMQESRAIFWTGLLNLFTSVAGNLLFVHFFGVYGIPIATLFVCLIADIFLLYLLVRAARRMGASV